MEVETAIRDSRGTRDRQRHGTASPAESASEIPLVLPVLLRVPSSPNTICYYLFPGARILKFSRPRPELAETKLPRKRGSCCIYPHPLIPRAAGTSLQKRG